MRAESQAARQSAIETDRPSDPETDQLVEDVLEEIAKTLWPENTAPNLASKIGCEVRTVERYFEGARDWSGDAVAVIVAEILRRHGMRNFKVKPKR